MSARPGHPIAVPPPRTVTGAILAGGRSSRMGRPKQHLRLADGRTMIEAVAQALGQVCQRIVIVGEADGLPNCVRISDLRPDAGPLGGIEAALAGGIGQDCLFCPCDLPLVTGDFLNLLSSASDPSIATAIRLEDRPEPEPLPLRISPAALPIIQAALDRGQRSIWSVLPLLNPSVITIASAWSACLVNINTGQDWRALRLTARWSPPRS